LRQDALGDRHAQTITNPPQIQILLSEYVRTAHNHGSGMAGWLQPVIEQAAI
jgi:hypothetical protein